MGYGSTAMYMQGFEWEGTTCVVFLFSSWVISTRLALALACIGTILLGVLTEMVTSRRRAFLQRLGIANMKLNVATSSLLYAGQVTMGYAVMLIVMTYSGPLVLSVIIGLALGHGVNNWKAKSTEDIKVEGSTPCCKYDAQNPDNDSIDKAKTDVPEEDSTSGNCCDA